MIDYMEGIVIDPLEGQELINRLVGVFDQLSTLINDKLSTEDMEIWFNDRLFPGESN